MSPVQFYKTLRQTFLAMASAEVPSNLPDKYLRASAEDVCSSINYRAATVPQNAGVSQRDMLNWGQGMNYLKNIVSRSGCVVLRDWAWYDEPTDVISISSPHACYANVQATLEMSDNDGLIPMGGCLVWLNGGTIEKFAQDMVPSDTLSDEDELKLQKFANNPQMYDAVRRIMSSSINAVTPWSFQINPHAFFLYEGKVFDPTLLDNPMDDWYYVGFPLDKRKLLTGKRLTGTPSRVTRQLPLTQSSNYLTASEIMKLVKSRH